MLFRSEEPARARSLHDRACGDDGVRVHSSLHGADANRQGHLDKAAAECREASRREGDLEAQIQHALQQLTLSQRPDRAEKEKYARFARGEAAVAKARAELARECEPDRSARAVPSSREDREAREVREDRVREARQEDTMLLSKVTVLLGHLLLDSRAAGGCHLLLGPATAHCTEI